MSKPLATLSTQQLREMERQLDTARRNAEDRLVIIRRILWERYTERTQQDRANKAQHGTDSGYYAHRRARSGFTREACDDCKAAHAEATAAAKRLQAATGRVAGLHGRNAA